MTNSRGPQTQGGSSAATGEADCAPRHRRTLHSSDVIGWVAAGAGVLLIVACWTTWVAPIARAQEHLGGDTNFGRLIAGWLPTGMLSWSAALLIVVHPYGSRRLREGLRGVVIVLAGVSLATVPVLVSTRSRMTNVTEIDQYFTTLSRNDEFFQAGRVAAFVFVNGTVALSAVALLIAVFVAAPIAMRRERLRSVSASPQAGTPRSYAAHTTMRAVAVVYLVAAPILVLIGTYRTVVPGHT